MINEYGFDCIQGAADKARVNYGDAAAEIVIETLHAIFRNGEKATIGSVIGETMHQLCKLQQQIDALKQTIRMQ